MKRALFFFAALLLIAGGIVGAVVAKTNNDKVALPGREVDTFLHAWARNDAADMATLLDAAPPDLAKVASGLLVAVPGSTATFTRTALGGTADAASATYHAKVSLKGLGPVEWDGSLALVHSNAGWRITWNPRSMYPGLEKGQHLSAKRVWPARAAIQGADGRVLAGDQPIVKLGLWPAHIKTPTDLEAVKFGLKSVLAIEPTTVDKILNAPGVRPDDFQYVATLPMDKSYTNIHNTLIPIPGIIFHGPFSGVTSVDDLLATQILGKVGDITAEQLKKLGPPYETGDQVGLSGLQSAYEERLAGTPQTNVVIVDGSDTTITTVKRFPGVTPKPVQLTIDLATQKAAEAALASVTNNAALVALDTKTGAIRAVVSKPDFGFNRALAGTYPPGSTFKVVTSAALLAAGNTGTTPAPCPKEITVEGRVFKNFEGEASTSLDLAQAFAQSCNNSFIGLSENLSSDALEKSAALFGFNAHWKLGVESASGSYPQPTDRADRAASAIGQGRVLASPLQMASVAATVASGRWHAPTLLVQPAPAPGPTVGALSPAVVTTLQSFMADVVRSGTASGKNLPADSFGKTGTAEFGNDNPPHTHAWYIGYRGDLAFAVIVEDGGVGGRVAAPLAANFLNDLPK